MIDLKAKFAAVSLLLSLCFIRTRSTNSWTWHEQGIGKVLAKQCFAVIVLLLNQVPFWYLNATGSQPLHKSFAVKTLWRLKIQTHHFLKGSAEK